MPSRGNSAQGCPARMKATFAAETNARRRDGLEIRYKTKKTGKKMNRKVSEERSIYTSVVRDELSLTSCKRPKLLTTETLSPEGDNKVTEASLFFLGVSVTPWSKRKLTGVLVYLWKKLLYEIHELRVKPAKPQIIWHKFPAGFPVRNIRQIPARHPPSRGYFRAGHPAGWYAPRTACSRHPAQG